MLKLFYFSILIFVDKSLVWCSRSSRFLFFIFEDCLLVAKVLLGSCWGCSGELLGNV